MDRNTILAVVLAVVVIIGGMVLQSILAPSKPAATLPPEKPSAAAEQPAAAGAPQAEPSREAGRPSGPVSPATEQAALSEETHILENELMRVRFTNRGGEVSSIQLKEYKNTDGSPVEMVISKDTGLRPFSIHFGDHNAEPVNALFLSLIHI